MKKLLSILAPLLMASSLQATITAGNPAYDPFADASASGGTSYTLKSFLVSQTNAQGLTWAPAGTSNAFQPVITNGNLSYPSLLPSTGNSVAFGPANSGDNGDTARLGLGGALASGTVYYSMLLQVVSLGSLGSAGASGADVAGFNNSTGSNSSQPSVIFTQLHLRTNGTGGYNFGLDKGGSSLVWDTTTHNVGETVLVVGGYTFNTGGTANDVCSLWIDPASSSFGQSSTPAPLLTASTGSDISSTIQSFMLRQGSHLEPPMVADDVRIGIIWGDVTPPVPVAPSFSNLTPSQSATYGSTVTLSGTLSAPGSIYPNAGETITVTINGNAQAGTVTDSTGDFSVSYNLSSVPASNTPYTITYSYAGDLFLSTASDTSTSLTVTPLPVILYGTRAYNGTPTANASILSVANRVGGDNVTVASGSATLASAAVGSEPITSLGTITLGGTAAGNYTVIGGGGSVTISINLSPGQPVYEPFLDESTNGGTSYTVGSDLIGQINAQGLTWYSAGPLGNQPQPIVSAGNLTVSGLAAPAGNSASYGNGNGDSARLGVGATIASGTIYYSMALEVTALGGLTNSGAIVAGFNNLSGSQTNVVTVIGTRLEMRLAGSGYNIGLDKSGSGLVWDAVTRNVGDTVFVVGSYTFNPTTNTDDSTSLWIDPASSTFGASVAPTPTLVSSTGNDINTGQIESLLLREGSTTEPSLTVDEIRVGLTWADVTPPPSEIASFSHLAASQSVVAGTTNVILSGTVSASSPFVLYPSMGETITATIDGNAQATTIDDSTGDFSFGYNPSGIPSSGSPYPVAYAYAGNGFLSSATDSSTTLTVTPPPPTFSITSEYIDSSGANIVLNWASTPGATYQVIGTTNLTPPIMWTNVGGPIMATGTNTSATNAIIPPQSYFSVESP